MGEKRRPEICERPAAELPYGYNRPRPEENPRTRQPHRSMDQRQLAVTCNRQLGRMKPSYCASTVRGEMALAAKDLGEATPSCHICSVGEWVCLSFRS